MAENSTHNFQASWNLSEPTIMEIAGYLKQGRAAWLNYGNCSEYYWKFDAVIRVLFGIINEEEKIQADKLQTEIQQLLLDPQRNKGELSKKLREYDGFVMTVLHKYRFLVPPKVDRTRLIA